MALAHIVPFPATVRRPGLDALRAAATILVLLLHAGVPYTVAPMPGLIWPVRHTSVSATVDAIFWGIEGAVMPLFFLLSGYVAAQSLSGKPERFLQSRWRRLGRPLIAAAIVLLPIELYIWLIGLALDGQIPWRKVQSLKLGPDQAQLWGLSHLWYLEYLLLYSLLLCAGQRWMQSPPSAMVGRLLRAAAHPLVLFASATIILCVAPEVVVGFQHSFLPSPAKFLFSGLFFAVGVAEFHYRSRFSLRPTVGMVIGALLLIPLLPWIHRQAAEPLIRGERVLLAVGLATYITLVTQSAWRWAWHSRAPLSPAVAYLARASFWVYLIHHPLVALWQIALRASNWPALPQFTIVSLGTLAMSLASYELLVRHTWIGAFLEGRRITRTEPAAPADIPARRAA